MNIIVTESVEITLQSYKYVEFEMIDQFKLNLVSINKFSRRTDRHADRQSDSKTDAQTDIETIRVITI